MSFFGGTTTASYKPPTLIRQEGFHLPHSPSPPLNPSHSPVNNNNDIFAMGNYLPDAFRKVNGNGNGSSGDFGDELASLMVHSPPSSHERSTHSPDHHENGFNEDYRHNIFDISAPTSHPHSNPFPNHFSLPPPSHLTSHREAHPTHDFHFNPSSTLPALNSSMRFDPPPLEPSSMSSVSSNSTYNGLHSGNGAGPGDFEFSHVRTQHTPSPHTHQHPQRSRSRSRAPSNGPGPGPGPGPTRTQSTTRTKRNSISSTSPPPPPSHHRPNIVIPPQHHHARSQSLSSPLTSGWFVPQTPSSAHSGGEYLASPTSDSFSSFGLGIGLGGMGGLGGLGISPKDIGLGGLGGLGVGMKGESPPVNGLVVDDVAAKQAAMASEKRRRRRESHNAVERRRRDNINERISELATLIPECMLDPNAPASTPNETDLVPTGEPNPNATTNGGGSSSPTPSKEVQEVDANGAPVKANKGMILRKSVEYIRYLQQLVTAQASRNRDLEDQLRDFRGGAGSDVGDKKDLEGMMLHEDIPLPLPEPPTSLNNSTNNRRYKSARRSSFTSAFEQLESVEEDAMDVEGEEGASEEEGEGEGSEEMGMGMEVEEEREERGREGS